MDFLKNVFDYFVGNNSRRDNEDRCPPVMDIGNGPVIPDEMIREDMGMELPYNFNNRTFGGSRSIENDMPGFQVRNNPPFFGDFSSLFQIINHFEEAINEMEKNFSGGSIGFHNFPGADFEDMGYGNGGFSEPEKTLSGERLRNYYMDNSAVPYQGDDQIRVLNDRESDNNQTLIFDNKNKSDFTTIPYFKSQARYVTTKLGPDGVAEITTIIKDESGNEERMVRKVKLF